MKNHSFIILLVSALLIMFFAGCNSVSGNEPAHIISTVNQTMEEQTMEERSLLTPEELIKMANLPQNMYERDFLERFINHYFITQKNFDAAKVERLLPFFEEIEQQIDVQSIFRENTSEAVSADPSAITVIAFYENINTGIDSVYYDFQALECYRGPNIDVFRDLTQVKPRSMEFTEATALREKLIDFGVLDWVDTESHEEIDDPQAMCLAIRFQDGSLFRVSASGLLYEDGPAHYSEVRDLLLGD